MDPTHQSQIRDDVNNMKIDDRFYFIRLTIKIWIFQQMKSHLHLHLINEQPLSCDRYIRRQTTKYNENQVGVEMGAIYQNKELYDTFCSYIGQTTQITELPIIIQDLLPANVHHAFLQEVINTFILENYIRSKLQNHTLEDIATNLLTQLREGGRENLPFWLGLTWLEDLWRRQQNGEDMNYITQEFARLIRNYDIVSCELLHAHQCVEHMFAVFNNF